MDDIGRFRENVAESWQLIALYTVLLFGLVKLNCSYYSERKKMTPEERRQQDEEDNNRYD